MGVVFSDHLVFFYGLLKLKVKFLCLILGGFVLVGDLIDGAWLELAVQLGGGLTALLFLFRPSQVIGQARSERAKRRFLVIDGGKKGKKKDEKKYWN
jgi:hypothetical protein